MGGTLVNVCMPNVLAHVTLRPIITILLQGTPSMKTRARPMIMCHVDFITQGCTCMLGGTFVKFQRMYDGTLSPIMTILLYGTPGMPG